MVLVRQELGDVLRDFRLQKGRTLRQVASRASVALGYLSEVERGQKEASSEILASVAEALDVPISIIMREVGDRISVLEGIQTFPDVVPDDLVASVDAELSLRGAELMADRREAGEALAPAFEAMALELGLPEPAQLTYRPRSSARDAEGLAAELAEMAGWLGLDGGVVAAARGNLAKDLLSAPNVMPIVESDA